MIDLEKLNPKWKTCQIPVDKDGTPSPKNVITPLCLLSYPHLLVAQKNKLSPEKPATFQANLLIPPEMDISLLKQRARECAEARWGAKLQEKDVNGRPVMKLKSPFLKAEEYKGTAHMVGWTLLRVGSPSKPTVLMHLKDGSKIKITEGHSEEIYGGRWALVTLNPFAYPKAGTTGPNTGVSLGLNNVFLMHNDDPLGGRARAEDEFGGVDGFEAAEAGETGNASDLF